MNYENKSTLYEEAKASLKKFKGDESVQEEKSRIKLEPAYPAENEEALLAAGYVKSKSNSNFDSRTGARRDWGGFGRSSSSRGSQKNFSPKSAKNRKMNPVGTDGRTLTCKCCGSFRHLVVPILGRTSQKSILLKMSLQFCLQDTTKMKLPGWV